MAHPHVDHVRQHLQRVEQGQTVAADPNNVYLGGEDQDHFWELVGLRMRGTPMVVLTALRFQRHHLPGITHARESLASYLTSPPTAEATSEPGTVAALFPSVKMKIPSFLQGLRAGRALTPVNLSVSHIEAAFDFRLHNPSALASQRQSAGPLHTYLLRTVDGHVIRGESLKISVGRQGEGSFVAVKAPVQLGASGVHLPAVILSTSYLALAADATGDSARLATQDWAMFQAATANPDSIVPMPRAGV